MNKLFNTILLSTTLVCCSNSHSTMVYNPLYDLDGAFLKSSSCKIDNITSTISPIQWTNNNFGRLYFQEEDNGSKLYLEDEEGMRKSSRIFLVR